jgi:hypothetical protein
MVRRPRRGRTPGNGTIRQAELDEALRKVLANERVLPEFIAAEVERSMGAVFAS